MKKKILLTALLTVLFAVLFVLSVNASTTYKFTEEKLDSFIGLTIRSDNDGYAYLENGMYETMKYTPVNSGRGSTQSLGYTDKIAVPYGEEWKFVSYDETTRNLSYEVTYLVIYNTKGGTINDVEYTTTYRYNDPVFDLPTNVTKTCATFNGWYSDYYYADWSYKTQINPATTYYDCTKLYAKWTEQHDYENVIAYDNGFDQNGVCKQVCKGCGKEIVGEAVSPIITVAGVSHNELSNDGQMVFGYEINQEALADYNSEMEIGYVVAVGSDYATTFGKIINGEATNKGFGAKVLAEYYDRVVIDFEGFNGEGYNTLSLTMAVYAVDGNKKSFAYKNSKEFTYNGLKGVA